MPRIITIIWILLIVAGCRSLQSVFNGPSPYEQYISDLDRASLLETNMGKKWLKAGRNVFNDSISVPLPYSETGFFPSAEPEARSYRFKVKAGQVLTVNGLLRKPEGASVFLDLFIWEKGKWEHVSYSDSGLALTHEFKKNSFCLLRLQPELLTDLYYSIVINLTPALINPVSSASNRSIGSIYGDPRDGGSRSHEGIDIFAARGTPVIAPAGGIIARTGTSNLGGKVIWMLDSKRGHSYYFAHLDTHLVGAGKLVKQGDTIGLVGNTGNARNTPPHLHFGIYQYGSMDPLYFVRQMESISEVPPTDTAWREQALKVNSEVLNLRASAALSGDIIETLEQDTYVKLIGKTGNWVRVMLPDHRQGFVAGNYLGKLDKKPVEPVKRPVTLLSAPHLEAIPMSTIGDTVLLSFLARYGDFDLVTTDNGYTGWMYTREDSLQP